VVRRPPTALLTLGEGFHPLLSGEENAVTGAMLAGCTRREAVRRLASIASFAELEDRMDQPLRTYSDGMRLRLAFAVAISAEPEILLIDEVLAVGDLRFQQKCLARLSSLQGQGVTVALATHDLGQVRTLCQQALWLDGGAVRAAGPAESVVQDYERAMHETMPPPQVSLQRQDGRVGTREVDILAVRLLDASGRDTVRILPGTRVRIEIDYAARAPVPDAIFGVSAHTDPGGERCFEVTTESGGGVGPLSGSGTVRLDVDRLDLGGGMYHLAVGVYEPSWAYPYDYIWEARTFEVAGPGGPVGFTPPHSWSMA
jgi:lipopolysaccharide transport system ATP-binding protein